MKAALLQLCSGDDPMVNLPVTQAMIAEAAKGGADFVLTPEVTNCVSGSRTHQQAVLQAESEDITLQALRAQAQDLGISLLIGSLGIKTGDADGRFANRSFLVGPDGDIAARYDKIHMFDVDVDEQETYRESAAYRPGKHAVIGNVGDMCLGLTVCYDVRFAYLHRALADAGAQILSVPAAFSPVTGAAHWETLLRARAIETGCYVLAPAQTGQHSVSRGRPRRSYGHSLAVAPWGEVLIDAGTEPGIHFVEISPKSVASARARVPALMHTRTFEGP